VFSAIKAVPALPGATKSLSHNELCLIFQAIACSLPPFPMISIFMKTFFGLNAKDNREFGMIK
jgi:hypothetical protein